MSKPKQKKSGSKSRTRIPSKKKRPVCVRCKAKLFTRRSAALGHCENCLNEPIDLRGKTRLEAMLHPPTAAEREFKSTIGKVKDLSLGQAWIFDQQQCVIESFPTRNMLVLRNVKPTSGSWSWWKTSIRFFKESARRVEG